MRAIEVKRLLPTTFLGTRYSVRSGGIFRRVTVEDRSDVLEEAWEAAKIVIKCFRWPEDGWYAGCTREGYVFVRAQEDSKMS